ncbi:MAG: N-acetyl-gamma-glutamyl-phosphate reductase [Bdellovibrionaceae bacterium]|nr:N-acetyl-gamma-glutamyl-phosphate reductase [Pseudobdellovibrionaceae bacterium]
MSSTTLEQKNQGQTAAPATGHRVAIVGARGYSGQELARLLLRHPEARLAGCFASNSSTGTSFQLSHLLPEPGAKHVPTWLMAEFDEKLADLHTVFLATPAEVSLELAPRALAKNVNVVDLSGAFRLKQATNQSPNEKYRKWYGFEHTELELLLQADYGLQPFARPAPHSGARLVANPGCYATAVLMAALPLLESGLIIPESLVIDAKSGTSGGGRKASENLLFTEVEGECLPYKIAKHQHWPEIVEAAWLFAQEEIAPFFTTHLLNTRRGIIASLYAKLKKPADTDAASEARIQSAFAETYSGYPLVRFGALGSPETDALLSLKRVVGTPRTHITFRVDGDKLYVFSTIDNLVKGAAGQAVENFNRLLDRPLHLGLTDMEGVL